MRVQLLFMLVVGLLIWNGDRSWTQDAGSLVPKQPLKVPADLKTWNLSVGVTNRGAEGANVYFTSDGNSTYQYSDRALQVSASETKDLFAIFSEVINGSMYGVDVIDKDPGSPPFENYVIQCASGSRSITARPYGSGLARIGCDEAMARGLTLINRVVERDTPRSPENWSMFYRMPLRQADGYPALKRRPITEVFGFRLTIFQKDKQTIASVWHPSHWAAPTRPESNGNVRIATIKYDSRPRYDPNKDVEKIVDMKFLTAIMDTLGKLFNKFTLEEGIKEDKEAVRCKLECYRIELEFAFNDSVPKEWQTLLESACEQLHNIAPEFPDAAGVRKLYRVTP